ncbi:MAG TPA: alpha/beta family hydrolase [Terriglobales bacterium]|nr:alpha/beta family hydrolase [Terriglobales bacterium]
MPQADPFSDTTVTPSVSGHLHRPENPNGDGLVLSHGAGSNARAPLLMALAEEFSSAGYVVLGCDLPYRQARPYGPPGPGDAVRDRKGLQNAVSTLRKMAPGRMFLGGHSYGGRQSSMLCAEQPGFVDGLLLMSYPLHPPRKPEQLRTQHLPDLRTPCLFVEGTRDPFGSIQEIEAALQLIPAKTELLTIEGAGHDLGFKGKMGGEELAQVVRTAFLRFFSLSDR